MGSLTNFFTISFQKDWGVTEGNGFFGSDLLVFDETALDEDFFTVFFLLWIEVSGDDVALDIGSIAAAGERCIDKVVMVEETEYDDVITCKHSYSEKCHTTYSTAFSAQQEEDCEENFVKSCFIEYKKVASEEAVTFCHTPILLEGDGDEVCQTVYESACTTRYA